MYLSVESETQDSEYICELRDLYEDIGWIVISKDNSEKILRFNGK